MQMLSILTKLETEDSNASWDLLSLQGTSSDGILLMYALFKSSFDSSGTKLATEISNPALNFNDLAAFSGNAVPEKKAEKKVLADETPSTPIVAVTSPEKLLPAVSAVNATDNQAEIFDILKSVISDNTSERYRNYFHCS